MLGAYKMLGSSFHLTAYGVPALVQYDQVNYIVAAYIEVLTYQTRHLHATTSTSCHLPIPVDCVLDISRCLYLP